MIDSSTLKNIGMALSGLSAGISGRGAEFANSMAAQQQAEEARQHRLSAERQQAMAIDARVVRDHLENALNPDGSVRDQKRLDIAKQLVQNRMKSIAELGGDPSDTAGFASALDQDPAQALNLVRGFDMTAQERGLVSKYEAPKFGDNEPLDARKITAQGQVLKTDAAGNVVAVDIPGYKAPMAERPPETPKALLVGLSPEVAAKADAAYKASGGGKDGMLELTRMLDQASELERKTYSPNILKANFPKATEAELAQLQSKIDASKTVEEGLKEATKLRADQRRLVKAKDFKERTVNLLDRILSNPNLENVLGSIEGRIDFRLSDAEAELIQDIEEAKGILTTDNLDLMVGVLSESDLKMLKAISGGALARTRSVEKFRNDSLRLRDKIGSANILTADDVFTARNKIQRDSQTTSEEQARQNTQPQEIEILKKATPEVMNNKVIKWSDL